jgi:hypothetical protein
MVYIWQDYMDDVHGKEISLQYVTVKVPGQKPHGSKSITGGAAAGNHFFKRLEQGPGHMPQMHCSL